MYVYLVINKLKDFFTYKELVAVCANDEVAKKHSYLFNRGANPGSELVIERKRVNRKDKVFVLKELYDDCAIPVFFYEAVSTSEKRLKGYMKHICQKRGCSELDYRIQEVEVLQS